MNSMPFNLKEMFSLLPRRQPTDELGFDHAVIVPNCTAE